MMKLFQTFGCGCIGIDLGEGKQIVVDSCSTMEWHAFPGFRFGESILPKNIHGNFLPEEEQEQMFRRIGEGLAAGNKFAELQNLLGVERK